MAKFKIFVQPFLSFYSSTIPRDTFLMTTTKSLKNTRVQKRLKSKYYIVLHISANSTHLLITNVANSYICTSIFLNNMCSVVLIMKSRHVLTCKCSFSNAMVIYFQREKLQKKFNFLLLSCLDWLLTVVRPPSPISRPIIRPNCSCCGKQYKAQNYDVSFGKQVHQIRESNMNGYYKQDGKFQDCLLFDFFVNLLFTFGLLYVLTVPAPS